VEADMHQFFLHKQKNYFEKICDRRLHGYMAKAEKIYFQKNCNGSLHAYMVVA
jgi:hypothetical protein